MNVSPSNGGIVTVNGYTPASYPVFYDYPAVTQVTVQAVPAAGYQFNYWTGCVSGSANPITVTVNGGRSITAYFSPSVNPEPVGTVDGLVWEDADGDGMQDGNETGIDVAPVSLYRSDGTFVSSTTTSDGYYSFSDVAPGDYYVVFDPPSPYLFSPKDQGQDDTIDSDAYASGRTDIVTINTAGTDLTLDAGIAWYLSNHLDLTPQEAKDMVDGNRNLVILDVREASEFCSESGHIFCAINYSWNSGGLEDYYELLDVNDSILVVCGSGRRSRHAAEFLDAQGFASVYNMTRGMSAWEWDTITCDESAPLFHPTGLSTNLTGIPNVIAPLTVTLATQGSGNLQYRFFAGSGYGSTWSEIQPWSVSNSLIYTPSIEENVVILAWISDDPAGGEYHQAGFSLATSGHPDSDVVISTFTTDLTFPQPMGTPVQLTAQAVGHETIYYKFWYFDCKRWVVIQDWSLNQSATWIPAHAGTYTLVVWASTTPDDTIPNRPIAGITCTIGE